MKTWIVVAALVVSSALFAQPADLIVTNAKVFTSDASRPWAEAVAIRGTKIVAVGTSAEIAKHRGDATKIIDAAGRTVIPGVNDAHTHPGSGYPVVEVDAKAFDPSWQDLGAAIADAAKTAKPDAWIMATIGPSLINDRSLTRDALDELAPNRRIVLQAFTGHGMVMSSAAMKAAGIAETAKDPIGGWYERDANGRLNGRSYEYAQWRALRPIYDQATDAELVAAIQAFAKEAIGFGITSVQSMPLSNPERFAKAVAAANVPLRIRVINFQLDDKAKVGKGTSGVKWILDGTPIERNAATRGDYPGGGKGRLNFTDIRALIKAGERAKQQILLHAVGDRTIAATLDAFAAEGKNWSAKRPRLEHADGLVKDLLPRAKSLGVVVVQNPLHFQFRDTFPGPGFDLARSILDAGIPFAFGSDGPLNPYLNIMAAVDQPGAPAEALTREQAVIAYTRTSAFAEFKEKEKGTIAPGMLADLAILSQDIFTVPAQALPGTTSVVTIIGGKVVHQ